MSNDPLDIGYSATVEAVMTVEMASLRTVPTVHRTVPPPAGSLAARGYTPLPKLTPEQRAYADMIAAAATTQAAGVAPTPV